MAGGGRLNLEVGTERWPLRRPFRIAGRVFTDCEAVVVRLSDGAHAGRGEAEGVYYRGETAGRIAAAIKAARPRIEAGITRAELLDALPPGGARNAVDCALWDLEARRADRPVWALAELPAPRPLVTYLTVGADTPEAMAEASRALAGARAIKLKLLGDGNDGARVAAVRAACPDVALTVDANQSLTPATLDAIWQALVEAGVSLVEQPFPLGADHWLEGSARPLPVAADESAQDVGDLARLAGRFDAVNIKLDKCGGLTAALAMAREARRLGLRVMVGNMLGTSLAMAPGFVLGQVCDFVDLDGPTFLVSDRSPGVRYEAGMVRVPEALWGGVVA